MDIYSTSTTILGRTNALLWPCQQWLNSSANSPDFLDNSIWYISRTRLWCAGHASPFVSWVRLSFALGLEPSSNLHKCIRWHHRLLIWRELALISTSSLASIRTWGSVALVGILTKLILKIDQVFINLLSLLERVVGLLPITHLLSALCRDLQQIWHDCFSMLQCSTDRRLCCRRWWCPRVQRFVSYSLQ